MTYLSSLSIAFYRPAAWLRVSGADAKSFLQGQFTNDLNATGDGKAIYGLWLNQKGRILADSFIIGGPGSPEGPTFWVGSYFSPAAVIRKRLEDYIIADDVVVEDLTNEWAGVSIVRVGTSGPPVRADLGDVRSDRPTGLVTAKPGEDGTPVPTFIAFPGRRTLGENWEWIFPAAQTAAVKEKLTGAGKLTSADLERLRLSARIPAIPADLGPTDLPNEAGLETAAISYTKGCYLGQEVMARIKSLGRVRRRLLLVTGKGAPPAAGAPLWQGSVHVGEMRSSAPDPAGESFSGLAMFSLAQLRLDAPLALSAGGPPAMGIVAAPISV